MNFSRGRILRQVNQQIGQSFTDDVKLAVGDVFAPELVIKNEGSSYRT